MREGKRERKRDKEKDKELECGGDRHVERNKEKIEKMSQNIDNLHKEKDRVGTYKRIVSR